MDNKIFNKANLLKIKNASDLKLYHELFFKQLNPKAEPYYFSRNSMKFFGDTMSNYKIKLADNFIELHRKKPVKHGLNNIAYFNYNDFQLAII
jgi:hypothetical protein